MFATDESARADWADQGVTAGRACNGYPSLRYSKPELKPRRWQDRTFFLPLESEMLTCYQQAVVAGMLKQVDLRSMTNSEAGMNEHVCRSMGFTGRRHCPPESNPEYRPTERHLKRPEIKRRDPYRIVNPLW